MVLEQLLEPDVYFVGWCQGYVSLVNQLGRISSFFFPLKQVVQIVESVFLDYLVELPCQTAGMVTVCVCVCVPNSRFNSFIVISLFRLSIFFLSLFGFIYISELSPCPILKHGGATDQLESQFLGQVVSPSLELTSSH